MVALPPAAERAIERSARPRAVRPALEWLVETVPELGVELAAEGPPGGAGAGGPPSLLSVLVLVLAASPALGRLLRSDPAAIDVLRQLGLPPPEPEDGAEALVAWKRRELLRIAARDLAGLDPLEGVGLNLALMADTVLAKARAAAGGAGAGLAVVAMGKAGALELNYASDVDVLLVGEGDPRVLLDIARRCFRVDVDLRPEGRSGPLTRSLESYAAYWERWAEAWERQALLKARPVAGPPELCGGFAEAAAAVVWGRPFTADDLRQVRHMKARTEGEVRRRGVADREIKRGPGGIRDVEFSVQLLQMIHGATDPRLRAPATLDALAELAGGGYIAGSDAADLETSYRFMRAVENRLQMAEEEQTHTVPADPAARHWLARVTGFADDPRSSATDKLDEALRRHRGTARAVHERLFFRPLLEAFASVRAERLVPTLSPDALGERLAAFGFADTARARAALVELTRGLSRSSRMMQALLPLMLEWLSESPDPDLGLLSLRRLMGSARSDHLQLVGLFRESPEAARRLCALLGTSPLLQEPVRRDPGLVGRLVADGGLAGRSRAALVGQARAITEWRSEVRRRQRGLRLFKLGEEAVVMAADILGQAGVAEVGRRLSDVAEATLGAALAAVEPPVPMAVIGLGRLGGAELSYASDLDVLVVAGPGSDAGVVETEAAATRLLGFVLGETPAWRIYNLDLRLRPEGKQGALARTIEGYDNYYRRWAGTWERQALLRARPVAGDPALGEAFMALARRVALEGPFGEEERRQIRRMKARVETERVPAGEDPDFHLKLGRGSLTDVEWTVQLLQLEHRVAGPATLAALADLVAAGAVDSGDAGVLSDSYRFCEQVRNRLYLVQGTPGDSLPTAPERLATLARSLELTPQALRDRYRRVTRRARRVVERLFYGGDV